MKYVDNLRVVVVGGGIGGAELIRNAATKGGLELILIEPKDQIECQALYPDYLGGLVELDDMVAPLKPFCERMNVSHVKDRVLGVDWDRQMVICDSCRVQFDILVVATGAIQNYYGVKGVENTFSINTLEETIRARDFIYNENPKDIVIIGSGLTGIETAGILADRLDCKIYIVEMMDRPLPTFSRTASNMMKDILRKKGVRVLTSKQVMEVGEDQIEFSNEKTLGCQMAIWTAGIKPSPFVERLDLFKENGWLLVDPYLRCLGRDGTFAIGDAAWVEIEGILATKTGMEAEFQAKHTARNLARLAQGETMKPYSVRASTGSPAALISTGCGCAVGVYGDLCIHVPAKLIYSLKSWIDKSFVKRFK